MPRRFAVYPACGSSGHNRRWDIFFTAFATYNEVVDARRHRKHTATMANKKRTCRGTPCTGGENYKSAICECELRGIGRDDMYACL